MTDRRSEPRVPEYAGEPIMTRECYRISMRQRPRIAWRNVAVWALVLTVAAGAWFGVATLVRLAR